LLGLSLMFGFTAMAQDEPKAEVFAGYSYVRGNGGAALSSFNMNGGSASVSYNPTPAIGIVADFGGYHVANIQGFSVDANVYTYMFGPKFAYRTDRFTPFVQALFGGAHGSASVYNTSANAFAMALGGGLDIKATQHIAIRAIQAEYLLTRFNVTATVGGSSVSTTSQNNARISAGVVFRF
jgi:opacity protein-like surface antigen